MKRLSLVLVVLALTLVNSVAKRGAPTEVNPVTKDGIVYSAPIDHIGCVEAKREKTGARIWLKQIYVIKYDTELERDVQDCFISTLELKSGKLHIANECGGAFDLDPATLEVVIRSGKGLIDHTASKRN